MDAQGRAGGRDVIHRAIYDHFRLLSSKEILMPVPTIVDGGALGATGNAPSDGEMTIQNPLEGKAGGKGEGNGGNHPKANEAVVGTMYLGQAPTTVDFALLEKYQRVLAVLEQEFPEILGLPGEGMDEGKSMSDLELRFTRYPELQQRVASQSSSQQGQMQPFNMNPTPNPYNMPSLEAQAPQNAPVVAPLPTGAMEINLKDSVAPPLDRTGGAVAAAVAATAPPNNDKKRKAPPPGTTPNLLEPSSKKLKEQESEIKKMKTQLKRAKDKIQKLSHENNVKVREGAEKKEKAMAAAVPFEQRYQELVHFQLGHGHCRVPCTSKENPGLARWVQTLRAAYKEKQKRGPRYYGQLTDERQKKMEGVGFEWSIQAPKATWEQRFEELKAYKDEHGHCRVVRSYSKNPPLGEWCHRQRFLAHKNHLEEHKVKQLTEIGFEIWVRRQGKSWEDHFAKLLDFRRKHQHLKVPQPDTRTKVKQVLKSASDTANTVPTSSKDGEGGTEVDKRESAALEAAIEAGPPTSGLATEEYKEEQAFRRWVVAQRDNYHLKFKKGIKSTLNNARVKKLDSIGFDWTREGGENDLRKIRRGELHHRNDPSLWGKRLAEVVAYKERFGDCNIPKEWPENKQLGAWVSTQRKMYKALLAGERSSLTPERRDALESIGFTWILRPARTRPRILEYERTDMNQRGLH